MKRRRLRGVLARQWAVFGVTLFGGFVAMAVLLMYLLEDQFIDRRLREVGEDVAAGAVLLPAGFSRYTPAAAPAALLERIDPQRTGALRELRLPDGRYVHLLAGRDRRGAAFLLVYDVTDQLYVNSALHAGWPWLLGMVALLAAAAWALASRFVGSLSGRAAALVRGLGDGEDIAGLRRLGADEPIEEFAELAQRGADAWEARLSALASERETLAFLGHELRTPLQSARTSLASLQHDRGDAAAWQRLQRAHQRLVRASQAILWLDRGSAPCAAPSCEAAPLFASLAAEFAPLARARRQEIRFDPPAGIRWPWPGEIVETIAANLLANAIQHGGPGSVAVTADEEGFVIENPVADDADTPGFGLGLQVASRLLQRFGGTLRRGDQDGRVSVRVRLGTRGA
ncbi:HAMP domain-containing sensor histidine kinase [Luteimonas sp. RD2P54]|uniref:histidine kinase n=1 Tax=Luteimonas endophytica TaxID=3042023 RepID=A0ABT6JAN2_9GAMM|nr:HAMP domain-containing sensor histidine kinase [Luteimonas endophytica]MDH5823640.1 HAMP domain-containing sensor histidine kinase [Luteimonas endophytica]